MRALLSGACVLVVTLAAACGPGRPEVIEQGNGAPSHVDASLCRAGAQAVPMPAVTCSTGSLSPALALGICKNLQADNTLSVQSNGKSALLAVNGSTTTASPLDVQGSFVSFHDIDARNTQNISGNVSTAGNWTVSSPVRSRGDAFVGGMVDARNSVTIDGTLHVNAPAAAEGVTAGGVSVGPVSVEAPLDCARAARATSVDAALRPDAARLFFGHEGYSRVTAPTELDLGCGQYLLAALEVNNTLTLHVTGSVLLVIDGDLRVASPMVIELDRDAQLSLVVRGNLNIDNTLTIAAGREPSQTWVAVGGNVRVASPFALNGTLVMPDGDLAGDNTFDLRGQALVGGLRVAAPMVVRMDTASPTLACAP